MKNTFRLLMLAILCTALSFPLMAQKTSAEEKANERVETINAEITKADASLALTDEQKKEIKKLHIERTKKIRTLRKEELSAEEKKTQQDAAIKSFNQTVINDVLTKEQNQARRKAKRI